MARDYYRSLELKRDCTDSQIKQAYRRLALKWHPEKNAGKQRELAEQNFADIAESYEVLSDRTRHARTRARHTPYHLSVP
jgi:DnaJ-class molecular chaperone